MAEADLTISISGKDVNATSTIKAIVKALDLLEKEAKDTSKKVGEANEQIKRSFEKSAQAMGRFSGEMSRRLQPMAALGGRLIGIFGAAGITGAIYKSIGAMSAFQDSMTEISTLMSGDATAAVKEYSDAVKKLSKESGKSTQELSKGLYQVISAGTKGTEKAAGAMELLDVAQKAATAGVSNTFAAVDALTTVLNAYNTSTKDSARFSDILFTTVKLGKTTFNELAGKIGVVASTAAGAGISFEDLNAAIAQLTKGGLNTDIAISGLNSLIVQLVRPSKELESSVQRLGKGYKNVSDMLGKEGLAGAMRILNQLTGGSTEKIVKLIPSVDALKAASILAGTGMESFNNSLAEFKKSGGATEEAYKKMSQTFSFQTQQLKNKMELMFLDIGERVLPKVMDMAKEFSSWFEKNAGKITKNVADFVETLMKLLQFLVKNADTIIKVLGTVWAAQKLAAVADGIIKITLAIKGLNLAMMATGGKVAALLAAVATVGYTISKRGGLVDSGKDPDALIAASEEDWAARQKEAAGGILSNPLASKFGLKGAAGGDVAAVAKQEQAKQEQAKQEQTQKEIEAEKKLREAALKYLDELEVSLMDERQKLLHKHIKETAELAKLQGASAAERVKAEGDLMMRQAMEMASLKAKQTKLEAEKIKAHEEWIKKVTGQADEQIQAYHEAKREEQAKKSEEQAKLKGFWAEVAEGFAHRVGEKLYEWALEVAGVIAKPFTDLIGTFSNLLSQPFNKISDILGKILGGSGKNEVKQITEEFTKFIGELGRQLPGAIAWFAREGVPQILDAFIDNLPDLINALVDAIPTILHEIISRLDQIIMPFVKGILTVIPKIIDEVPKIIAAVIELLPQVFAEIADKLPAILGSVLTNALKVIPDALHGFVRGLQDIFNGKDKAEFAAKARNKTKEAALSMGYSEEDAEAIGELRYEKEMGRAYDPEKWAKYAADYEKNKALRSGKSEEEAQAIYDKVHAEQLGIAKEAMGKYTGLGEQTGGKQTEVGLADGGTLDNVGMPVDNRPVWEKLSATEQASYMEKWKAAALPIYQQAYTEELARLIKLWPDMRDANVRAGMKNKDILKAEKEYKKESEATARQHAETKFQEAIALSKKYETRPYDATKDGNKDRILHQGGYIEALTSAVKAIRAHSGVSIPRGLAPDEVPIIAQAGEAVMNRRWVQNAGGKEAIDAMNQSGGAGKGVVNNVYVEHMMSNDTAKVIDGMISDNLRSGAGKLYEKLNTGGAVGYKTRRAV
jgi:TP901 family phage tail tape measure protein